MSDNHDSFWVQYPEKLELMIKLRNEAVLSTGQIARCLSDAAHTVTRNACIGKLARMHLPSLFKGAHTVPLENRPLRPKPLHKPVQPKAVTLSYRPAKAIRTSHRPKLAAVLPIPQPTGENVPLMARTGCAWVTTDLPSKRGHEALYCNAPLDLFNVHGASYCEFHRQKLYYVRTKV